MLFCRACRKADTWVLYALTSQKSRLENLRSLSSDFYGRGALRHRMSMELEDSRTQGLKNSGMGKTVH
jgi:hypothetical protein